MQTDWTLGQFKAVTSTVCCARNEIKRNGSPSANRTRTFEHGNGYVYFPVSIPPDFQHFADSSLAPALVSGEHSIDWYGSATGRGITV